MLIELINTKAAYLVIYTQNTKTEKLLNKNGKKRRQQQQNERMSEARDNRTRSLAVHCC